MKQCFGYVRVSTVKQGDGVSLEAQREAITAYAYQRGFQITKWFEETVTAAKKGRPQFNKMISDLRRKRADGVVFHKIDRSTRNHTDWASILELHDRGVVIKFAADDLDLDTRSGRLMADMLLVLAADYVRNLRDESIKGQKGRLKQGVYPYAAPIGYLDAGAGVPKPIDPKKGPLVRELFTEYASGRHSYQTLAQFMTSKGLTNTRGTSLTKISIESVLKNSFYTGLIQIKRTGETYTGNHVPLISDELFAKATAVRTGRRRKVNVVHDYSYRGAFQCKACGRALIGERQKGRVYYRCHSKNCSTSLREDRIDEFIVQHLSRLQLERDEIGLIKRPLLEWINELLASQPQSQAPMELTNIEHRLSELTDKMLDGLLDEDTFKSKQRELIVARTKWRKLQTNSRKLDWYEAQLDHLLECMRTLDIQFAQGDPAFRQSILKFAGSNFLGNAKNIEIEPPKWLSGIKNMGSVLRCGHDRAPTRTLAKLTSSLSEIDLPDEGAGSDFSDLQDSNISRN